MASLGVKLAKNIWVQFVPPLNLVLWHIQNGRNRNHIFGHNLGSSIAVVTILMSISMVWSMRNTTHTKCVCLVDILILKIKHIFHAFLVIFWSQI